MILRNKNSEIIVSEKNGSIVSYKIKGKDFCVPGHEKQPLFTIKMIDDHGKATYFNSLQSEKTEIIAQANGCRILFRNISGQELCAEASIIMDEKGICHWHLNTENGTGLRQEWFDCWNIPPQGIIGESCSVS
ncbi:MAG: hypothetical protein MR332_03845 [Fusicatenibacter sp.]|nr:hypothetical protein [Fusicatenibacter sp.]